ncbi:MAG: L-lactate dehydrogenase [Promethearchaeota archaeon CR_4]|nr:MAG: L-lactate dehydrogenase [Candidatus Lokiarchaeota archaeon CR_4]
MEGIFHDVRDAVNQIIDPKGETSYGIGLALTRITSALLNDENSILPVSSLLEDYYGISDVYLSLPTLINEEGAKRVINMQLSPKEQDYFRESAATVKKYIQTLRLN